MNKKEAIQIAYNALAKDIRIANWTDMFSEEVDGKMRKALNKIESLPFIKKKPKTFWK